MTQETEFIAYVRVGDKTFKAYDRKSPKTAYEKLLELTKEKKARISKRSFFIIQEIDYDPSHKTITYSVFGNYGISGKKYEIESMLSIAS